MPPEQIALIDDKRTCLGMSFSECDERTALLKSEINRLKEACAKEFASVEQLSAENERLRRDAADLRSLLVRAVGALVKLRDDYITRCCTTGYCSKCRIPKEIIDQFLTLPQIAEMAKEA